MEKIAVVIPLFNHGKFIRAALQSALDQTRPPDRILVIDDGSEDDSVARAREVANPRIEIFEQPNAGAHAAINRGIAMTGDCGFVAILNSDDLYHPRRLELGLKVFQSDPAIQLVCTGLRLIDPEGAPLSPDEPRARWFRAAWSTGGRTLPERLGLANFPGTTSNFIARTRWLAEHPFRPYRYAHDYFALIHAAVAGVLHVVPETLLDYRVHPANTITTRPENLTRELLRVHLDALAALAPLASDRDARQRMAGYFRAAWGNVSSFRADVFQAALAQIVGRLTAEDLAAVADAFTADAFPELAEFPNRDTVNLLPEDAALGDGAGLAEKIAAIRRQLTAEKIAREDTLALARLRGTLARSRWMALGVLAGPARKFSGDRGKSAREKRESLEERLRASAWVRLGAAIGSRSCREALGRQTVS